MFLSFGKKRRSRKIKSARKPPAALLKRCRKYRIKTIMKKGGKRVYRSVRLLKKLLARKMRKLKKSKKVKKTKSGFGSSSVMGYSFDNPTNYGYNQEVKQYPQALSQSSMVSNERLNISRPDGMGLSSSDLPVYGVYRNFFGQESPTQIPPNWDFMGQPDGSLFPVGAPFQSYKSPIAFGKKRRYRKSNRSACSRLKKKSCNKSPLCHYTKGRGCRRKSAKKAPSYSMSADEDLGSYANEAGISFFGLKSRRRRHYNVPGSVCNKLKKNVCRSSPSCTYTRRGCRRRSGTKKGLVYEGPSLAFGKKRRCPKGCGKKVRRVVKAKVESSYPLPRMVPASDLDFGRRRRRRSYN